MLRVSPQPQLALCPKAKREHIPEGTAQRFGFEPAEIAEWNGLLRAASMSLCQISFPRSEAEPRSPHSTFVTVGPISGIVEKEGAAAMNVTLSLNAEVEKSLMARA